MSEFIIEIPNWYWPLPFSEKENLNNYLDSKIGTNPILSKRQRLMLVDYLYKSISLDTAEKLAVIRNYPTLSNYQFDELCRVFNNEIAKFHELEKEFTRNISGLVYKSLLEWSLLINQEHGDVVFLETFFGKDKIFDFKESKVMPFINVLSKNNRNNTLYNITRRLIKDSKKQDYSYDLHHTHLYSIAKCRLYNKTDKYSFKNIEKMISTLSFSERDKANLFVHYYYYVARDAGFPNIQEKFVIKYVKKLKKPTAFLYNLASSYFLSDGDLYNYLKFEFKSWKKQYNSRISVEAINKLYEKKSLAEKRTLLSCVCEIILDLLLSGKPYFRSLAEELAPVVYELLEDAKAFYTEFSVRNVFMLEFILNKNELSSSQQFQLFMKESVEDDLVFLSSINDSFVSVNQFISSAKRVLEGLETYERILGFMSFVTIYLFYKSPNKETNLFIFDSLEKLIAEKEDIEFYNELNIFKRVLEGSFNDSLYYNCKYYRLKETYC